MSAGGSAFNPSLVGQARKFFVEHLVRHAQPLHEAALEGARALNEKPAERAIAMARRDMLQDVMQHGTVWPIEVTRGLRTALNPPPPMTTVSLALDQLQPGIGGLSLVDDDTIQREILVSRLGLSILDKCTWEFSDLRSRLTQMMRLNELPDDDIFRVQRVARVLADAWSESGLALTTWQGLEEPLQKACAEWMLPAYHEANKWLIERGVMPEVNLRPLIRKAAGPDTAQAPLEDDDEAGDQVSPVRASAFADNLDEIRGRHGGGPSGAMPSQARPGGQPAHPSSAGQPGAAQAARQGSPSAYGGQYPGAPAARGMGAVPAPRSAGSGPRPAGGAGEAAGDPGQMAMPPMPGLARRGRWSNFFEARGIAIPGAEGAADHGGGGSEAAPEVSAGAAPQGEAQTPYVPSMLRAGPPGHTQPATNYATGSYPTGQYATGHYPTGHHEETHLLTRPVGHPRADVVLESFAEIMERNVPGFRNAGGGQGPSQRLAAVMDQAQQHLVQLVDGVDAGQIAAADASPSRLMREMRQRQQVLKDAARDEKERSIIEVVAMMFQSILMEERIPAHLRVWFARLQMPVLRVAVAEPEFFSSMEHPARRLIDRMGAVVMGFDGASDHVGPELEKEIRRVVQVIEAFPDTGKRVFQTVLKEFETFLEKYLVEDSEVTRQAATLAAQIEQREALGVQYTIELRKMLNEVEVDAGIRDFLFHVWADVLATTSVRHGAGSDAVRVVREAATDLLWTASTKATRAERAEVIRRLPPLLTVLRQGMSTTGMTSDQQEAAIRALNKSLTAAFSARTTPISEAQLAGLKERLATIEEMLPDADDMDFEIDESWVLDEEDAASKGLEVVAEGGSMPSPDMLKRADDMPIGMMCKLDLRGRRETVRLLWRGARKQLALFAASGGKTILFQKSRMAAFLQAGLLIPSSDEPLTISATRQAMAAIQSNPSRLR